jgi:nucleoside-diphosphate-sugar epimerase
MKRVLVTGARGFLGRQTLLPLKLRDYEVHAVTTQDIPQQKDCHWHLADLLDIEQVKALFSKVRPTHLLHLAWYSTHRKFWTHLDNFRWVQASLEILQQFYKHGGTRVVTAGTCAEYDWDFGYCSEQFTPIKPKTLYGICKNSLQVLGAEFCTQVGISSAWGRIFFLYGPGEHPERLASSVIRSLSSGMPALCSHGRQIRDYLYVRDAAEAFVALLDSSVQGSMNIASGVPLTLKTFIETIGSMMGKSELIRLDTLPTDAKETPFLVADISNLSQLSWKQMYSLETGLSESIHWWSTRLTEEGRSG